MSINFIQVLLTGLTMGSVYTLMGLGLFITFLTSKALNFGQGDFLMIAAFIAMALGTYGMSPVLVILLTLAAMAVIGVALERVAIRPLERSEKSGNASLSWVLTTMGAGMILQNVASITWGKSSQYSPSLFSDRGDQTINIGGIGLFKEELIVAVVSLTVVAVFCWMLYRTRWGKATIAVSFDKTSAALFGINVRSIIVSSYVTMALLAGIAGILIGPISNVQPHMGLLYVLKGFAVVCIGGFANPLGLLVAGLGFGAVEAISNYFDSNFGDLYPFILVLVLLMIKPSGLFGEPKSDVR
ncbi:branched-chain amino acid ABC transporter permease [Xanthobacteraceae bacterium A53D]